MWFNVKTQIRIYIYIPVPSKASFLSFSTPAQREIELYLQVAHLDGAWRRSTWRAFWTSGRLKYTTECASVQGSYFWLMWPTIYQMKFKFHHQYEKTIQLSCFRARLETSVWGWIQSLMKQIIYNSKQTILVVFPCIILRQVWNIILYKLFVFICKPEPATPLTNYWKKKKGKKKVKRKEWVKSLWGLALHETKNCNYILVQNFIRWSEPYQLTKKRMQENMTGGFNIVDMLSFVNNFHLIGNLKNLLFLII